jgi:hypothetical protein
VTAFFASGIALAVWAVVLSALGLTRPSFPGGRRGERAVIAVSIVLMALTVGSGIVGGLIEAGHEEAEPAAAAATRA